MSFLIRSNELFQGSVFPITAARFDDRPLVQADLHRHEYFEMIFVAKGVLHNRLADADTTLKAGDILILKPFVQHQLETWSGEQAPVAYTCSFLPPIVDSAITSLEEIELSQSPNRYFFKPFLSLTDEDTSAVIVTLPKQNIPATEETFRSLATLASEKGNLAAAKTKCVFLELLLRMANHVEQRETQERPAHKAIKVAATRHRQGLLDALSYIHSNLSEPLSLEEVAKVAHVSVSYFSLLIKQYTGMSFIDYLTSLRMDLAKTLMRDTTDNMMGICLRVGYNDYSNFSKRFKAITGFTPRDYRNQQQKQAVKNHTRTHGPASGDLSSDQRIG